MSDIQLADPGNEFIKEIRPNLRQEDFLSIPDEVFEALYGGSAYSGKSFLLTLFPIIRGFYKFQGFKGIILRRKFPDLERENIRLSKMYYPQTGGIYNEQKHVWEWKEYGSYVDFGHIQHSSDVRQYDSSQYNYACFDELTSFTEDQYIYLVGSRVRPSSSFNIAISRNGTNPGGVGQTFVYNRFVKPCEGGYKLIKDSKTGLSRIFIPAFAQDNTQGMEYDPTYLQKLEMLPEAEKRAKKYGDWHAFKGSVFTTFRPIKFPNEPDNALHVIEPFAIPQWWPRILSIDWGKRALCHAMWLAISPNRRVYIYREKAWSGRDISYWASEIRDINNENNEVPIQSILCGSAWQNRGSELISDEFQRYSGLAPSSSENTAGSRVSGLQLIHDMMRWEKIPPMKAKGEIYDLAKAQQIYRIYGPESLENYKKQFYDGPDEDNLPILQIFNTCKILIDTIPMCIYSTDKIEDIEEFNGDDPIDNLRYACKAAKRFLLGEVEGLSILEKRQEVINQLAANNDMTSFYRKMERLEKDNLESLKDYIPVSRRSRFARRAYQ